ncbi:hypothetical protein CRM22_007258 [Opisthorchis felineus]|uniref:Uncharacterized protein n=1 Tax=Opisthorchis felineus TaxID=147828 RepID=A0A4S2LHA1_OPIFE|nr:hypothetical protein CRM22_007258 [Opisthorchis felineus]
MIATLKKLHKRIQQNTSGCVLVNGLIKVVVLAREKYHSAMDRLIAELEATRVENAGELLWRMRHIFNISLPDTRTPMGQRKISESKEHNFKSAIPTQKLHRTTKPTATQAHVPWKKSARNQRNKPDIHVKLQFPRLKSRAFLSARLLDHGQSVVKEEAPARIMRTIPAFPNGNLSTTARRKQDLVRVNKEKVPESNETIIFGLAESEITPKGTVKNKQTKISADTDVYHFAKKMKQQKSLEELRVYTAKLYQNVKCFCDRLKSFTDLCRKTEQSKSELPSNKLLSLASMLLVKEKMS